MTRATIIPALVLALLTAGCGIKDQPGTPSGRPLPVEEPQPAQADLPTD